MPNYITIKAANCARELCAGGYEMQKAIGMAAASCDVTSYEIAHELNRRSAEAKARKRKQKQIEAIYRERMRWVYEN